MNKDEFEKIHDEIELKVKQALRRHNLELGLVDPSVFTRKDVGIKARTEVYNGYDHGATNFEIQKAIEKVVGSANNESGKEHKASEFLKKIASKGFYGYLKLAKLLGMPKETFTVRTWYGIYLPRFPSLINLGGEVKLMEGQFNISKSVDVLKSNIALRGTGDATKLLLADGVNVNVVNIGDGVTALEAISIVDLQIDGNRAKQTAPLYGIYLNKVTDSKVLYITFQNVHNQAIHGDYCERNRIFGNTFKNCNIGMWLDYASNRNTISFNHYIGNDNETTIGGFAVKAGRTMEVMLHSYNNLMCFNIVEKPWSYGIYEPYEGAAYHYGALVIGNRVIGPMSNAKGEAFELYRMVTSAILANVTEGPIAGYAIYLGLGSADSLVIGNAFRAGTVLIESGQGHIVKFNYGYVTENSGTATFSGDGTTTTFDVAHGLANAPSVVKLEGKSADAATDKYWIPHPTEPETYFRVTFVAAPPKETDNVVINWQAEMET